MEVLIKGMSWHLVPPGRGFSNSVSCPFPVKAYTATSSQDSEIRFNQLHAECNSRIQYKKWCPIHEEVKQSDIVSGYEYSKGQYVIVDADELDKLRTEDDKAISIDTFVPTTPWIRFTSAARPITSCRTDLSARSRMRSCTRAWWTRRRVAVAQVVLSNRKQLVLIRPVGQLIAMTVLNYDHQVTKPVTFEDEVVATESTKEETSLVQKLINETTTKKFDLAKYKDTYREELTKLIEAKVAGQEIVAPPMQAQPQIINLVEALRQSVEKAAKESGAEAKPPRKMAPSTKDRSRELRKKSS